MQEINTITLKEETSIKERLFQLDLDLEKLLMVRSIAIGAAADVTPFHPVNSRGILAYHNGTWALRNFFVEPDSPWTIYRTDGIEGILHEELGIKVIYSNVDAACHPDIKPKPRSKKGSSSEKLCSGNLFDYLPEYLPESTEAAPTYYLMVDEEGAAELTRPYIQNETFILYKERIFLCNGVDINLTSITLDNDDILDDFDPLVTRK